ncbi:hypothetical protein ALC56_13715 [Trachymyrmex septentrionalis]|uniref:Uncharacterized protein n=1 Tax=Trachymyrmex septentrionalis TaxID=34720 RepID=A0A195EVN4_9HYME|nr:hypothetical protein ALC56_13715 [Trachymyrmex septentrionalis]
MCRNSRPTGDILASDVTSLTGTTPKMRRIYTRRPDATRELIYSHVMPVDVCITRAFNRQRITRSRLVNACVYQLSKDVEIHLARLRAAEGHNSFAVLHTCSQLTDEGDGGTMGGRESKGIETVGRCKPEGLESAGQALCVIG